jgi:hypothetical protein
VSEFCSRPPNSCLQLTKPALSLGALLCVAIGTPAVLDAQVSADTLREEGAVYQALVDLWRTHGDSQPGPMLVASVTAPGWGTPSMSRSRIITRRAR